MATSKVENSAQVLKWVENNPTNIRIFPTNIRFIASWYYADGSFADFNMDVARCLDGLVSSHPRFCPVC
jgi:hypothetical protein